MYIVSKVENRKELVKALEKKLGIKPEYKGAPTFAYLIGDYTILKDGNIDVSDSKADIKLLRELHIEGLVDNSWDEDRTVIEITLPLTGHTGKTLTNLVFMVASRAKLINKSIRCMDAFKISDCFIESLDKRKPETLEEFFQIVENTNANKINKGLEILRDKIKFKGFPFNENQDEVKAYMELATLINKQSLKQNRVKHEMINVDNEKYAFRVWLIRIGMKGKEYKNIRKILLENLPGNSAFKTEEQAEAFKIKHRKQGGTK